MTRPCVGAPGHQGKPLKALLACCVQTNIFMPTWSACFPLFILLVYSTTGLRDALMPDKALSASVQTVQTHVCIFEPAYPAGFTLLYIP